MTCRPNFRSLLVQAPAAEKMSGALLAPGEVQGTLTNKVLRAAHDGIFDMHYPQV
jgi:hypothetical protein